MLHTIRAELKEVFLPCGIMYLGVDLGWLNGILKARLEDILSCVFLQFFFPGAVNWGGFLLLNMYVAVIAAYHDRIMEIREYNCEVSRDIRSGLDGKIKTWK